MDTADPQSVSPSSEHVHKAARQKEHRASSTPKHRPSNQQQPITDQVTVTQGGKVHQAIQEILRQVPDIRRERVVQIRTALESDNYQVSSDLVADRLIRDIVLNQPPTKD